MKIPWIKLTFAGILLLLVMSGIHYVSKSLPPSKVKLVFKGFTKRGTNDYATFDLTNPGPRTIYWELERNLILETNSGWITNRIQHFIYISEGTPPGSNEYVSVEVPSQTRRWMLRVDYSSFQKHNVRFETWVKLAKARAPNEVPRLTEDILRLFPEPKQEYHEIYSEIFTNQSVEKLSVSTNSNP